VYRRGIEKITERLVFEAGINCLLFNTLRVDQLHGASRRRDAPVDLFIVLDGVLRVLRGESALVVVGEARCRGPAEKKLMGGKTRALIGLKHVIGPAVVLGDEQVWVDQAVGIVD